MNLLFTCKVRLTWNSIVSDSSEYHYISYKWTAFNCNIQVMYRIYPAIRRGFVPIEWLQITKSVLWNFDKIPILPFLNNPKDLDPSYKTDIDLWDCFGRKKLRLIIEEIRYININMIQVRSRKNNAPKLIKNKITLDLMFQHIRAMVYRKGQNWWYWSTYKKYRCTAKF